MLFPSVLQLVKLGVVGYFFGRGGFDPLPKLPKISQTLRHIPVLLLKGGTGIFFGSWGRGPLLGREISVLRLNIPSRGHFSGPLRNEGVMRISENF